MSFIGKNPKLNTLGHTPQSTDPANPVEGQTFYSDGSPRAEGLWIYDGAVFVKIAIGSAGALVVQSKSVSFTADITDDLYICDAQSNAITATLPTAIGNIGKVFQFNRIDAGQVFEVLIATTGGQTIQSFTETRICDQGSNIKVVSDGANWQMLDRTEDTVIVLDRHNLSVNNPVSPLTGVWQTRALTVSQGAQSMLSLDVANKQITLTPGKYEITGSFYCRNSGLGEIRFRNIDIGATAVEGDTNESNLGQSGNHYAIMQGFITVAVDTIFQVQHNVSSASAQGFGLAGSLGTFEKYGRLEIKKII